jgi:hypothetical protein
MRFLRGYTPVSSATAMPGSTGAAPDRGADLDEEGGIDKDISGAMKETDAGALESFRAIEGTRVRDLSDESR